MKTDISNCELQNHNSTVVWGLLRSLKSSRSLCWSYSPRIHNFPRLILLLSLLWLFLGYILSPLWSCALYPLQLLQAMTTSAVAFATAATSSFSHSSRSSGNASPAQHPHQPPSSMLTGWFSHSFVLHQEQCSPPWELPVYLKPREMPEQ